MIPNSIWILWGVTMAAWFGIAEYMAVSNDYKGDTLSENLRELIGKHKALWYGTLVVWIVFTLWFLGHIWFEIL